MTSRVSLSLTFLLVISLGSTANAAFVQLAPGDMPAWDPNLRFIEYGTTSAPGHVDFNFSNDSVSNLQAMLTHPSSVNVGADAGFVQLGKSDGSAPGFTFAGLGTTNGTWSYTGPFDLLYMVLKAGNNEQFALFELKTPYTQGTLRAWNTENLSAGIPNNVPTLSHMSFYGTPTQAPEPSSLAALASLAALGIIYRLRRRHG